MTNAVISRIVICTDGRVNTERRRYSEGVRRRRRSLYLLYTVASFESRMISERYQDCQTL